MAERKTDEQGSDDDITQLAYKLIDPGPHKTKTYALAGPYSQITKRGPVRLGPLEDGTSILQLITD